MTDAAKTFENLFSKNEKDEGFEENVIGDAEKKMGIRLPLEIRKFYLNQVKNELVNSCHVFERPEVLEIYQSEWIVFYVENQGIWCCAININDIAKNEYKIYIDFEQMGFQEEAESFRDFIVVKAACDYSIYIYPFIIMAENVGQEDIKEVTKKYGKAKSDINPKGYYRRRVFWENENEVIIIIEWDMQNWNGKKTIRVVSKNETFIPTYQELFKDIKWEILSQGKTKL